jgi:hypothetical protein
MDKRNILTIASILAILLMPVAFSGPLAGLKDVQEVDTMATEFVWTPTAEVVDTMATEFVWTPSEPDYMATQFVWTPKAETVDTMATEFLWIPSHSQIIASK